jgi:hypothetical protein
MTMKRFLFPFALFISTLIYSQKIATTFQNAIDSKGISLEKLDEAYQNALHSDSSKAAFRGREKEFYNGYVSLLNDLGSYLKENNFSWGKTTRCFNRIYINKTGEIDYFLFNFKPGAISKDKEEEFEKLLGAFIQTYQFPMTNEVNFAQCSPVIYADK